MPEDNAFRTKRVQSVEVAFEILSVFRDVPGPISLKEIGRRTGIAPAKAHRYLASMIELEMISHKKNEKYDLGPRAAELGVAAISRVDAINDAADKLIELVDETNCTAMLSVWGSEGLTVVRWERSVPPLVAALGIGSVIPPLTSATGLAYLTWSSERFRRSVVSPDDVSWVEDACVKIRNDGLAVALGTYIPGLIALAAPVLDLQGHTVGVVTLISTDEKDADEGSVARRSLLRNFPGTVQTSSDTSGT
ncbi:MAG: IclR family transcriptional regulator [Pseudomonadota bacterium]